MNTASASATGRESSVVKSSRFSRVFPTTRRSRSGSNMGISPFRSRAILSASLSTQVTWCPKSAKQAPDTSPTYPEPIIATRMRYLVCLKPSEVRGTDSQFPAHWEPDADQNAGEAGEWWISWLLGRHDINSRPKQRPAKVDFDRGRLGIIGRCPEN